MGGKLPLVLDESFAVPSRTDPHPLARMMFTRTHGSSLIAGGRDEGETSVKRGGANSHVLGAVEIRYGGAEEGACWQSLISGFGALGSRFNASSLGLVRFNPASINGLT